MALSFIHTADLQIGKPFGNFAPDQRTLLRLQRLKTLRRIAEIGAERKVDAVLVAGDVFETAAASNDTAHSLLYAMEPYKGPWVLSTGNHDPAIAESVWARLQALDLPANVRLVQKPDAITLAEGRMIVLTAPLRRKHETEDLTAGWNMFKTPEGALRIGLAHGSVTNCGPAGTEATNPIAGDRDAQARLDYLALGDWHGTMQVGDRTWYSGTPEPDRFKANDSGNILLVRLDRPGSTPEIEKVRLAHYNWVHLRHNLNGSDDLETLEVKFKTLGEPCDRSVVAISLTGTIDLATRQKLDRLLTTWRARFLSLEEDLEGLLRRPTDTDLDRIDTGGFVRTALNRLRSIQNETTNPNQTLATGAIELLYEIHTGAESR